MWGVDYITDWYNRSGAPYVKAIHQYFRPLDENERAKTIHRHENYIITDMGFVVSFQALSGFFNYLSSKATAGCPQ